MLTTLAGRGQTVLPWQTPDKYTIMKKDNLNEFQQPSAAMAVQKQMIFTYIANLAAYIEKINQQLRALLKEKNESTRSN